MSQNNFRARSGQNLQSDRSCSFPGDDTHPRTKTGGLTSYVTQRTVFCKYYCYCKTESYNKYVQMLVPLLAEAQK